MCKVTKIIKAWMLAARSGGGCAMSTGKQRASPTRTPSAITAQLQCKLPGRYWRSNGFSQPQAERTKFSPNTKLNLDRPLISGAAGLLVAIQCDFGLQVPHGCGKATELDGFELPGYMIPKTIERSGLTAPMGHLQPEIAQYCHQQPCSTTN